ncbi:MAG TPA: hypothetical protein VJC18_07905, partial [bacterium]|nr:hypothetical protein [bacterium]
MKKHNATIQTLVLALCLGLLLNCGQSPLDLDDTLDPNGTDDNELAGNTSVSTACAGLDLVDVTEDINDNTTWKGDTVYVIRAWNFYVNATLVIEPGAIIKFHATDGPEMVLGGAGTILAQGTEASPIIFTSYKDDTHGCDNNGDGTDSLPAAKDWGSVDTNGLNGSIFDHCEFYYGGDTAYSATLALSAGSIATVINSTFAHNDGGDESGWYGAFDASHAEAGTVIQNNVFYDNVRPLSISVA